jgi:hypothetical protein
MGIINYILFDAVIMPHKVYNFYVYRRRLMIRRILVLGLLFISIYSVNTAYAGTLNTYEQDVLSESQGTFDYNGVAYQLDSSYVNQLRDYLAADDVDLTAEQRDQVLSVINDYIETGVTQGYLIPVSGQLSQENTGMKDGDADVSSDADDTGSESIDLTPTVIPIPNTSSQSNDITDNGASGNTDSETQGTNDTSDSTLEVLLDAILGESEDSASDTTGDDTSISSREDAAKAIDPDIVADIEAKENSIIKNTGFDLSPTIAMVILMGVIMLTAIYVTVRYHYFAQSDE